MKGSEIPIVQKAIKGMSEGYFRRAKSKDRFRTTAEDIKWGNDTLDELLKTNG